MVLGQPFSGGGQTQPSAYWRVVAVSGLTASEQQPAQSDFYVRTSAGFGRLAVLPAMPVEGAPARRLA